MRHKNQQKKMRKHMNQLQIWSHRFFRFMNIFINSRIDLTKQNLSFNWSFTSHYFTLWAHKIFWIIIRLNCIGPALETHAGYTLHFTSSVVKSGTVQVVCIVYEGGFAIYASELNKNQNDLDICLSLKNCLVYVKNVQVWVWKNILDRF